MIDSHDLMIEAVDRQIIAVRLTPDELAIELDNGRVIRVMATMVNGECLLLPVTQAARTK